MQNVLPSVIGTRAGSVRLAVVPGASRDCFTRDAESTLSPQSLQIRAVADSADNSMRRYALMPMSISNEMGGRHGAERWLGLFYDSREEQQMVSAFLPDGGQVSSAAEMHAALERHGVIPLRDIVEPTVCDSTAAAIDERFASNEEFEKVHGTSGPLLRHVVDPVLDAVTKSPFREIARSFLRGEDIVVPINHMLFRRRDDIVDGNYEVHGTRHLSTKTMASSQNASRSTHGLPCRRLTRRATGSRSFCRHPQRRIGPRATSWRAISRLAAGASGPPPWKSATCWCFTNSPSTGTGSAGNPRCGTASNFALAGPARRRKIMVQRFGG